MDSWWWLPLIVFAAGPFIYFAGDAEARLEWDEKYRSLAVPRDFAYYRARRKFIASRRPLWSKLGAWACLLGFWAMIILWR